MDAYCVKIRKLEGHFEGIEFQHVPRNNNVAADVLSKLGSRPALVPAGVFVQDLRKPSIKLLDPENPEPPPNDQNSAPPRDVLMSEKEDDWHKPFIDFILDQLLPDNKAERERITRRSANYVVIGTDLYRKATSTGVLMKCILRSEGLRLLAEIHSGECGCHAASTNLVGKAYRSGFYWPTIALFIGGPPNLPVAVPSTVHTPQRLYSEKFARRLRRIFRQRTTTTT
jgi:hypothetical protein